MTPCLTSGHMCCYVYFMEEHDLSEAGFNIKIELTKYACTFIIFNFY